MGIKLLRLLATGPGKETAIIDFAEKSTLIFGPSDTGKSHIFKAVNYLLGGDTVPDVDLTEGAGYTTFALEISGVEQPAIYTIVRGTGGGGESVYRGTYAEHSQETLLQIGAGEVLRHLAGVEAHVIYRKAGTTGKVTAGSLRHWCLLSETKIGQDSTVLGDTTDRTTNAATVSLLLTGRDDSGIQPGLSTNDKERAKGGIEAVELTIRRLRADIPDGVTRLELESALARVDRVLAEMNQLHLSRSSNLKETRGRIAAAGSTLRTMENQLAHRSSVLERFILLDEKYSNDLARLVAVDEGAAFFDVLADVDCPLCGAESRGAAGHRDNGAIELQRIALAAESDKIRKLQSDLHQAIAVERSALQELLKKHSDHLSQLQALELEERAQIQIAGTEFTQSPAEMAERRSILFSQKISLDEIDRLRAEARRLEALSKTKAAAIIRAFGDNSNELGKRVLCLLKEWGFDHLQSVEFDTQSYDIKIDGRRRLSFGMGTRSVFMTAYAVAMMEHSLSIHAPHPGLLVIDSPLKTYYEKRQRNSDDPNVEFETVRERFYKWLAQWNGSGQIVILENAIPPALSRANGWTEFTDDAQQGRQGFYHVAPEKI